MHLDAAISLTLTKFPWKQMAFLPESDCKIVLSFTTVKIHQLSLKPQNYFTELEKTSASLILRSSKSQKPFQNTSLDLYLVFSYLSQTEIIRIIIEE